MAHSQKRIVFTGGPSGGKTSIIDMVLRRFGKKVVVVPEAATILYAGGFPRKPGPEPMRHTQRAIYYTVRELEDLTALTSDAPVALCDRGTLDGMAYWPEEGTGFLESLGTSREKEFARYIAVFHLRPPKTSASYQLSGVRIESHKHALELDRRVEAVWAKHPNRFVIEEDPDFLVKANKIMAQLDTVIPQLSKI
jgi:predicted ATPase